MPCKKADSHDWIRVHGAHENNLENVSVDIPKRRVTVFTGVSGSGKSSLVFATIAAESRHLINETYSTFVQGFIPSMARPDMDQEQMGANPRSTVGTATDATAMLRILFSRIAEPNAGGPGAYSFNVPSVSAAGAVTVEKGGKSKKEKTTFKRTGGMCPACEGMGRASGIDLKELFDDNLSLNEGALTIPGYTQGGWNYRMYAESELFEPDKPIKGFTEEERHNFLYLEPTKRKIAGINMSYEGLIPPIQKSTLNKDREGIQKHIRTFVDRAVTFIPCPACGGTRLAPHALESKINGKKYCRALRNGSPRPGEVD